MPPRLGVGLLNRFETFAHFAKGFAGKRVSVVAVAILFVNVPTDATLFDLEAVIGGVVSLVVALAVGAFLSELHCVILLVVD